MRVGAISKTGIPDIIKERRALITLLVGAEIEDATVSGAENSADARLYQRVYCR
jgi:hypothetical protein